MSTDRPRPPGAEGTPATQQLRQLLESFSLTTSESKTVIALLRLGSATPNQLARLTGISRPNLYPVLESLRSRQLATKLPGRNSAWVAPSREDLITRFREAEEEREQSAQRALEELQASLATLPLPDESAEATVELIDEVTAGLRYEEMLPSLEEELLVFNRGPHAGERTVMPGVVDACQRGLRIRALWQEDDLCAHDGTLNADVAGYGAVGVEQRVLASVPILMAVFDRSFVLLSIPSARPGDVAYSVTMAVDSRHFGATMAAAFEHLWEQGRPVDGVPDRRPPTKRRRAVAGSSG